MSQTTHSLVEYLKYLRDTSKNVVSGGDWYKCLLSKSKNGHYYLTNQTQTDYSQKLDNYAEQDTPEISHNSETEHLIQLPHSNADYKYFQLYEQRIKDNPAQSVFLGLGSIAGKVNQKRVFGSIVNIPIKIIEQVERSYVLELEFHKISVNYDLLVAILPDNFQEEIGAFKNVLNILAQFEDRVEATRDLSVIKGIISTFLEEFYAALGDSVKLSLTYQEPSVFVPADLSKGKTQVFLQSDKLFYCSETQFIFLKNIPGSLSTYENLNTFCAQIDNQEFHSPVLEELLGNVFGVDTRDVRDTRDSQDNLEHSDSSGKAINTLVDSEALILDEMPISLNSTLEKTRPDNTANTIDASLDLSEEFFDKLPISLSRKQKVSINKAFSEKISYIQGPPGTGKSHTISAIILAALNLQKKVLVVAQKSTALEVVRDKIKPYFEPQLPLSFIYFDKAEKKTLKQNVKNLISVGENIKPEEIEKLVKEIAELQSKTNALLSTRQERQTKLNEFLEHYSLFHTQNKELIAKRQSFDKIIPTTTHALGIREEVQAKTQNTNFLLEIKKLNYAFNLRSSLNQLELNRLKKLGVQFNTYFETKIDFVSLFKNHTLMPFLQSFFDVAYQKYENEYMRKHKLVGDDTMAFYRKSIDTLSLDIETNNRQLFLLEHKLATYQAVYLKDNRKRLDAFEKLLYFERHDKIVGKMKTIDYGKLLDVFPIWLCEIRNIGEILPNEAELFDLILIDESSQVNLAETLPVFYKSKNICVVGDHKQLGLNSVGLNFSLNKKFDQLTWEKYKPNNYSYKEGIEHHLTVSTSSILDLLMAEDNHYSFSTTTLDEHFRSLPGLFSFNNRKFYDGELKIMSETPAKSLVACFSAIQVAGKKDNGVNLDEAEQIMLLVEYLVRGTKSDKLNKEALQAIEAMGLNHFIPEKPTLGLVSPLRNQADYLEELVYSTFTPEEIKLHRLVVGTAEQMQGDEFDIVFISPTVSSEDRNAAHYSNPNRFNVMSSRARFYTCFVYTNVNNFPLLSDYLRHFNVSSKTNNETANQNILGWSYDEEKFDSEFEREVANYLIQYKEELSFAPESQCFYPIDIYNQVTACGQKRLDFVLYNPNNKKSVVIEVDGYYHFEPGTRSYSEEHNNRIDILTRAGWNIINTPYYYWYQYGRLASESQLFQKELRRIKERVKAALL